MKGRRSLDGHPSGLVSCLLHFRHVPVQHGISTRTMASAHFAGYNIWPYGQNVGTGVFLSSLQGPPPPKDRRIVLQSVILPDDSQAALYKLPHRYRKHMESLTPPSSSSSLVIRRAWPIPTNWGRFEKDRGGLEHGIRILVLTSFVHTVCYACSYL
ncbi:hypothetical protein B9Z19DRAFT_344777 [Tuber borchii]|uniref:Uncharacterized protein n=1 Tax=Tuber borchii TaxID=42251 RepID=A0A2T6ZJ25_TUBBO|nr:hypothetical protein B9Z19DRAFT_344777 [Tuber borchii]